jgi:hypothetical protein
VFVFGGVCQHAGMSVDRIETGDGQGHFWQVTIIGADVAGSARAARSPAHVL